MSHLFRNTNYPGDKDTCRNISQRTEACCTIVVSSVYTESGYNFQRGTPTLDSILLRLDRLSTRPLVEVTRRVEEVVILSAITLEHK